MSTRHTKETIQELMNTYCIGNVSHVDFTTMNKQHGFNEYNDGTNMMSAFVHFEEPFVPKNYSRGNCYLGCDCFLGKKGGLVPINNSFWDFMVEKKSYKIYVSNTEYWVCLLNTTPAKRTMMNIHQVVDNCRYLETQVEEQAYKITDLEGKIAEMEGKIAEMERTIKNIMVKISW